MLFSVIIPAYNAEKTIVSTLDTITKQNFFDVEVIVVNDGSTDSTKTIIETYIAEHKKLNIKLFNQENSGVSIARIIGINNSTGDYICFLDADDGLVNNFFTYLAGLINKYDLPDCINFQYHYVYNHDYPDIYKNIDLSDELVFDKNIIARSFFARSTNNALWNKVFKRELLCTVDLSPTRGITLGEDRLCNILIFSNLNNVVFTNADLYFYFSNYYNYKHSKKEIVFNDTNSSYLLNNVIDNLTDLSVIDDIKIHEIDKVIAKLKIKVCTDKIKFKEYKKYLSSLKKAPLYFNFIKSGYPKNKKVERRNKLFFNLIRKSFTISSFVAIKVLGK